METTVDNLQLGDEFLYSVQGTIARAKVIRPVVPKKVQPTHIQGKTFYKSVKCKVAVKETSYTTNWGGKHVHGPKKNTMLQTITQLRSL
jgi:hypothetical protein